MLERLSASELYAYYVAHSLEPWGELRADMRTSAGLAVLGGVSDWSTLWPYVESAQDIQAEFAELEKRYGSSFNNRDQAGRSDG